MFAVDTSLVVRLLTNDEPAQTKRAAAAFAANEIYIARRVLLETAWALRFSYTLDQAAILWGLTALLGMAQVTAEDSVRV
jgi:predicted nucleic-acid-binding protein